MTIELHHNDLPDGLEFGSLLAIDSETMGLNPWRDRLCLVQVTDGAGIVHLIQIAPDVREAPRLKALLEDPAKLKLFHFARFDVAALKKWLGIRCGPIWCTKIASKLVRTYTDRHGLKELARELLNTDVNKGEQSSYWGDEQLSEAQLKYAAGDVLHLHQIKARLEAMLVRENRLDLARACFAFVPTRVDLDLEGWPEIDIFSH